MRASSNSKLTSRVMFPCRTRIGQKELGYAVLPEQHEEWAEGRRYLGTTTEEVRAE